MRQIVQALDGTEADLLFGVPSYAEVTDAHVPWGETLIGGIRGVRRGIGWLPVSLRQQVQGIAPYAAWEMDDGEWELYRRLWLGEE